MLVDFLWWRVNLVAKWCNSTIRQWCKIRIVNRLLQLMLKNRPRSVHKHRSRNCVRSQISQFFSRPQRRHIVKNASLKKWRRCNNRAKKAKKIKRVFKQLVKMTFYQDLRSLQNHLRLQILTMRKMKQSKRMNQSMCSNYMARSKLSVNHYPRKLRKNTKVYTSIISISPFMRPL